MMHRTSPAIAGNQEEQHIQGRGENRFKVVQVHGENCRERKKEIWRQLQYVCGANAKGLAKQKEISNCLEWVLRNFKG